MLRVNGAAVIGELSQQQTLITALQQKRAFPHEVEEIKLVETHISWVLLTGPYAYKIKKSVDYGFLDFSSLEKRKHFCEREIELNRQYSEGLYLEVVPISGSYARPGIGGDGEAIEYAVKMRQFESGNLFSELADDNRLTPDLIDTLAGSLARAHEQAPRVESGSLRLIEKSCLGNIKALTWPPINDANDLALVEELGAWTLDKLDELNAEFFRRESEGRVRLCHGDLHLANITIINGRSVFFDCIEFNDNLRAIDIQSELAFLLMDLDYRQCWRQGNLLLNRYLQLSGDYAGLMLLNFYKVYRALVRAKVNNLQAGQEEDFKKHTRHQLAYLKYLGLAKTYTNVHQPRLTITHGLSGSGKSTQAAKFAAENCAIHLSSDIERKRLFGLAEHDSSDSEIASGIYTPEATRQTYRKLLSLAGKIIDAGFCVIVDASFLKRTYRDDFYLLSREKQVPFQILHCEASHQALEERLRERGKQGNSVSEAGIDVLRSQIEKQEPLTEIEKHFLLRYDNFAEAI